MFADPLHDPNSAFKLFRRATTLDRFPVQSDGEFVHVELVAKSTFLTCLMDELPLTPNPAVAPETWWRGFWKLFADAKFYPPADPTPAPVPPPADPPAAVLSAGEDGARAAAEPETPAAPATP